MSTAKTSVRQISFRFMFKPGALFWTSCHRGEILPPLFCIVRICTSRSQQDASLYDLFHPFRRRLVEKKKVNADLEML